MSAPITIFTAKKIHTMNPSRPFGKAVAVRDGRILGVGSLDELAGWGDATIDRRFADRVLLPGFVEAHSHSAEGGLWGFAYAGYFDRNDPAGKTWKGSRSIDAVVARLREVESAMTDPNLPLVAWGFDSIYFPGQQLTRAQLDLVSATRPVFVLYASLHIASANSALLAASGITPQTTVDGVMKDADGNLTGVLQELAAMSLCKPAFGALMARFQGPEAIRDLGRCARNAGVTTFSELGTLPLGDAKVIATLQSIVNDANFPGRLVPFANPYLGMPSDPEAGAAAALALRAQNSEKLWFGGVKFVLDGSIQGFTAKMGWPGYYRGADDGLWNLPPEQLADAVLAYHAKGLLIHAHCNGDLAVELFIDAVESALERHPRWDHRHTIQHCQLTTNAMYRRMKALGMCANIFTNHIFYWGDQHYELTVGPDRADMMNSPAMAKRHGVPFSMHCDASVTPLGGLHLAWCAVNRATASGRVLGELDKISVYDALEAVTLGAAYQLKRDADVGSIECGKLADFAVLEKDPFEVKPAKLKDVPVWGTVVGGIPFEAERTP